MWSQHCEEFAVSSREPLCLLWAVALGADFCFCFVFPILQVALLEQGEGTGEGTQESGSGPQCPAVSGNPHSSLSSCPHFTDEDAEAHIYQGIENHLWAILLMPRTGTLSGRAQNHSTGPSPCQESIQSPGARGWLAGPDRGN